MTRALFLNLLVLLGFVSLEVGIAVQWSASLAAIVGGLVLMLMGSWPYLSLTRRKKG